MNFLSQLFGGQPGVVTGIPQGMGAGEASKLYSGAQSPYPTAGPGGIGGPLGGGGLDIEGFAAQQYGKPNRATMPEQRPFGERLGLGLAQGLKNMGQGGGAPELPQMPQMGSAQGRLAEILASIGQRGNYLGRLGGTF